MKARPLGIHPGRNASVETWRDFGAALGPLLSGFFLGGFAMLAIYCALVLIMTIALLAQVFRRARRTPPYR